jgi:hypothetical protein
MIIHPRVWRVLGSFKFYLYIYSALVQCVEYNICHSFRKALSLGAITRVDIRRREDKEL